VKKVVKKHPPLKLPPEFAAALARNKRAQAGFAAHSPSCKREYVEWIVSAKREETRARRIATSLEWLSQGKKLNWKYENC
jgi:uncharacterized protein YdeI (YjbR/CyaY-like superfamily)